MQPPLCALLLRSPSTQGRTTTPVVLHALSTAVVASCFCCEAFMRRPAKGGLLCSRLRLLRLPPPEHSPAAAPCHATAAELLLLALAPAAAAEGVGPSQRPSCSGGCLYCSRLDMAVAAACSAAACAAGVISSMAGHRQRSIRYARCCCWGVVVGTMSSKAASRTKRPNTCTLRAAAWLQYSAAWRWWWWCRRGVFSTHAGCPSGNTQRRRRAGTATLVLLLFSPPPLPPARS